MAHRSKFDRYESERVKKKPSVKNLYKEQDITLKKKGGGSNKTNHVCKLKIEEF